MAKTGRGLVTCGECKYGGDGRRMWWLFRVLVALMALGDDWRCLNDEGDARRIRTATIWFVLWR